jgi:hypothetical protein
MRTLALLSMRYSGLSTPVATRQHGYKKNSEGVAERAAGFLPVKQWVYTASTLASFNHLSGDRGHQRSPVSGSHSFLATNASITTLVSWYIPAVVCTNSSR